MPGSFDLQNVAQKSQLLPSKRSYFNNQQEKQVGEDKSRASALSLNVPGMKDLTVDKLLEPINKEKEKLKEDTDVKFGELTQKRLALKNLQESSEALRTLSKDLQSNAVTRATSVFSKRIGVVSSSDGKGDTYLSCTALPGTLKQKFDISIEQLATHDRSIPQAGGRHLTAASLDAPLGINGEITVQGQNITIDATMSLKTIKSKLELAGTLGKFTVFLYTIQPPNASTGTPAQYQLVIQHKELATPLEIYETTGGDVLEGLNLQASGKDNEQLESICFINGNKVKRPTNEISDLMPGSNITFFLKKTTPDPLTDTNFINVDITSDEELVKATVKLFLDKIEEFVGLYNLYCSRDNEGHPLTEEAVLANEGFAFLSSIQSLLVGIQKFFIAANSDMYKNPKLTKTLIEKGNVPQLGLDIFGVSLKTNEQDRNFIFKRDEAQFNTLFATTPDAVEKFWAFSFTSDNPLFAMAGFPDKINSKLPNVPLFVKAWKNAGNLRAQLSLDKTNWTDCEFSRGVIKGSQGTLYEGLQLFAFGYEALLGTDPGTAAVSSFSFTKGNSQQYQENIGRFEETLKYETDKLKNKEVELGIQTQKKIQRLQTQKKKIEAGIGKVMDLSSKHKNLKAQLKAMDGNNKD